MYIEDNILKHYLKNCYFITGTAYAGKSTMCKMLAERYNMLLCEENYNLDFIRSIADPDIQPNICYTKMMPSWAHFVSRTPQEYLAWIDGSGKELAGFEIAELIRRSADRKVIVDTCIPCKVLKKITDEQHVAVLLSPQRMSVERFFDRDDPDKKFLFSVIGQCPDPEAALMNFRNCIAAANSPERFEAYKNAGFFTLVREDEEKDTREEMLAALANHFGLINT